MNIVCLPLMSYRITLSENLWDRPTERRMNNEGKKKLFRHVILLQCSGVKGMIMMKGGNSR